MQKTHARDLFYAGYQLVKTLSRGREVMQAAGQANAETLIVKTFPNPNGGGYKSLVVVYLSHSVTPCA